MNEKFRVPNFLTKKRTGPIRLLRNKFSSSKNSSELSKNRDQDPFPNTPQLLRNRLGVLNDSHEKGINVEESLIDFERKLIELEKARPKIRNEIKIILRDTRKSLAEKYGDVSEG